MSLKSFIIPLGLMATLAIAPTSAFAQRGGGHGGGGHMGGGHFGGGNHGGGGYHGGGHGHDGHGPVRGGFDHHGGFDHRIDGRFGHRFGGPFVGVRVVRPFHGPFFRFRPRFSLGFGLFLGYPVPYPWYYVAPYPYGYYPDSPYDDDLNDVPYDYPDPANGSASIAPSDEQQNLGGVSLNITPDDATVTVDGSAAGIVADFSPSTAPLTLEPGQHHIVIEKPGYHTLTFDADVLQGQVLPYQGTMQPDTE
jgi:PEGA domain